MKIQVAATVVVLLAYIKSTNCFLQTGCKSTCRDRYPVICSRSKSKCGTLIGKVFCPLTCNMCKWCPVENPPCLFNGTCFDANPTICFSVKQKGLCHATAEATCRKTCGYCHDCDILPEDPNACDPTCQDTKPACPSWKEYCAEDSEYKSVPYICPKTCGKCKGCELPPSAPEQQSDNVAGDVVTTDEERSLLAQSDDEDEPELMDSAVEQRAEDY